MSVVLKEKYPYAFYCVCLIIVKVKCPLRYLFCVSEFLLKIIEPERRQVLRVFNYQESQNINKKT